jgi:Flp pilus assembly protein TadD
VRVQLGELYRDAGDSARAAALLREAVALEPATGSYWNSLGMVLGGQDALAEAERAFRQAVERDPASARYRYNLGLALERQGRGDEARAAFVEALAADPSFGPARERLRGRR